MASQTRQPSREEEGRLSIRTLVIASVASAAAAVVVSQFWIAGTPLAAALTPVIVTLVSEMLHRPTEAVARRVTRESTAVMPEATGAGAPAERPAEEAAPPARELQAEGPPVRVYGRDPGPRSRRRVNPRVVAVTAALAFVIAAAALTLPELIAGGSIGQRDGGSTLFGGGDRGDGGESPGGAADPAEPRPEEQPEERPDEQPTTPEEEEPPPEETVPTPTVPTTPTVPEEQPLQ